MVHPQESWPSIAAMVYERSTAHADEIAVVDGDRSLTYAELLAAAQHFAAALVADGIEPRDRVAIWAPNSSRWIIAMLAIHLAGATLIPINTRFKGFEAADLLRRGRVRTLVTVSDFLDTDYVRLIEEPWAQGTLPDLRTVVVADGRATAPATSWDDFSQRASDRELAEVDRRREHIRPDDPADILFTSGTTGTPKGVVSGQRQSLAVARDWAAMTGLTRGDRYLMVNPYFHMFGLKAGILVSVMTGARMLPVPVFDAGRALDLVERHAVTVFPGPPTLYQSILDHPDRDRRDLSSLRVAVTGAADIPVELIRRIYAELPFDIVVSGYGLTEAGTAASTAHDDSPETIATTVGRARPGFEIRLVDALDAPVPDGEVGQIVLRGPSVMSGYLDEPATTESVLSPEGWLRTGDLGVHLPDGTLRIVGRTKEMFIVGGFNAYPAEIEQILMRHPSITAAAVVAVPDDRLGEVGMAFVVTTEPLTPESVIAWAREHMANYKVPRFVTVLDELPLTATGKVHKSALHTRATTERTS